MWRIGLFLKKYRQKVAAAVDRIPRKLQVLVNLLLTALLLIVLYIVIGCPTFGTEHGYRRIEKANLVGPAEILGYETIYTSDRQMQIALARTTDGVILSPTSVKPYYNWMDFLYFPLNDDITVTLAPQQLHWEYGGEHTLTMFVFDAHPDAVRAEMDIELFWEDVPDHVYRYQYNLEASRDKGEYFRFDLEFIHNEFAPDPRAEAIYQLSRVMYFPNGTTLPEDAYPVAVRLFDAAGKCIAEKKMQLFAQN